MLQVIAKTVKYEVKKYRYLPLGEGYVGGEVDLGLGPLQGQVVTEVAGLSLNLGTGVIY